MHSFADRVALITGAASGIGRQLARLLAAEGARVAALDLSADGLAALEAELKERRRPVRDRRRRRDRRGGRARRPWASWKASSAPPTC